jgi:hypothetical protein
MAANITGELVIGIAADRGRISSEAGSRQKKETIQ